MAEYINRKNNEFEALLKKKNFRTIDQVKKHFKEVWKKCRCYDDRRRTKIAFYSLKTKFSECSLDRVWDEITTPYRNYLVSQLDESLLYILSKYRG